MFYVSVVRGSDYRLLAGPYQTHEQALQNVDKYRRKAIEYDSRAHWYAFGTCKIKNEPFPFGIFTPKRDLFNWRIDNTQRTS